MTLTGSSVVARGNTRRCAARNALLDFERFRYLKSIRSPLANDRLLRRLRQTNVRLSCEQAELSARIIR